MDRAMLRIRHAPGWQSPPIRHRRLQLIRDTALFSPENIRWVFDASKVTGPGHGAFERVIAGDPTSQQVGRRIAT